MIHVLVLYTKNNMDEEEATHDCLACGEELGWQTHFLCLNCKFYLHVRCVLQPNWKSVYHRHPLKLIDFPDQVDDNEEEEEESSSTIAGDQYYCDHCEKKRDPMMPGYRCPAKGCNFVAHFHCAFLEGNLSIAHKLDNIELHTSPIMIKNPPETVGGSFLCHFGELMELEKVFTIADSVNIYPGQRLHAEDEDNSISIFNDLIVSSVEASAFMKGSDRLLPRTTCDNYLTSYSDVQLVEQVNKYKMSKKLAPVLAALFIRFGDFTAESTIGQMAKTFILIVFCDAMYNMICNSSTKPGITDYQLLKWWKFLKVAREAGFKIQFAVDRYRKALLAHFGIVYTDQAMDQLDKDILINILSQETGSSESECISSNKHTALVMASLKGDWSGEIVEFEGDYLGQTTWWAYQVQNGEVCIDQPDYYSSDRISDADMYSALEKLKHDRKMSLWDYQSLMKKIKTFFDLRHPQATSTNDNSNEIKEGDQVCSYGCDLSKCECPFYECTICKRFFHEPPEGHNSVELWCTKGNKHNFIAIQEPPRNVSLTTLHYMDKYPCCSMCTLPLWGLTYSCSKNHGNLHESCVRIPLEIEQHPLHPKHPLKLESDSNKLIHVTCYACGENCSGYAFSCESCLFYLEVRCIFIELTITSPFHRHPLTFIEEHSDLGSRCCSRCKQKIEHTPFLYCGVCKSTFHFQCALPSTMTCSGHRHSLTLAESYLEEGHDKFYCDSCEERRKPHDPVYHCLDCGPYVAHVGCAMAKIIVKSERHTLE